ncbi:MAG: DUF2284 domain-containing protein [Christensenellaceae bacterium]|nr:DUF2284 domain-containing protein [Christensenellaceae bacterium]
MNILKYLEGHTIHQYALIKTTEIPFSESVVKACEANYCGMYGKTWTCPPGVGKAEDWQKKVLSYENALVFSCKYDLEDSFDFEGMTEGQQKTKEIFLSIVDAMKKDGCNFMGLSCSGCNICEKCTYPDAPCRFPEKAIPSVEATGIYVVDLAKKTGIHYHNGANTVTYFCTIMF